MFIGREKELALLQEDYIGKAIMVYGKRRVGKTTLIRNALEGCQYQKVYFERHDAGQHQWLCAGACPCQGSARATEL